MREEHPDLENPLDHVTITPFQIYDQLLHNKEKLRAHEGLWIKNFNLINKGLNRRQENGKKIEKCQLAGVLSPCPPSSGLAIISYD